MKTNEVRPIDANALIEDLRYDREHRWYGSLAYKEAYIDKSLYAEHRVEEAPAIDAVPVVRCKDCRYSEPMKKYGVRKFGENSLNCTQCRGDDGYGYAGISVIYPDDYCSDGVPKDGEEE